MFSTVPGQYLSYWKYSKTFTKPGINESSENVAVGAAWEPFCTFYHQVTRIAFKLF